MQFFPYQFPYLGNGMVIGLNAVIHVLISHGVAIGAFAMVVFGEMRFGALRRSGAPYPGWSGFNASLLRFTVLVVTVVGAVTGAGIWFTTMTLAPGGIAQMLRIFFWAWLFEYFTFLGEIVLLIVIYLGWERLIAARGGTALKRLGIAYVAMAVLSAVTITAILGFMLTPGGWLHQRGFWRAALNASFLPQLVCRLSFSFVIGSLIALAAAAWRGGDSFRREAASFYGMFLAVSVPVFAAGLYAYRAVVPAAFAGQIRFAVLSSHFSRYPSLWSGLNAIFFIVLAACAAAAVLKRTRAVGLMIVPAMVSVIALVVQFERIREFIRGPYLMPGHMYVNQILLEEEPVLKSGGILAHSPWYGAVYPHGRTAQGAYLFGRSCTMCHTVGGLNDIRARLRGRTADGIYVITGHTHELAPFMPPFSGTGEERRLLADYLFEVLEGRVAFASPARSLTEEAP